MGIELKQVGLAKGEKSQSYHNNYAGWSALGKFIEWKRGAELPQFAVYQGLLESDQIVEIATALDSLTQSDLAKYKKECRDRVLTNPIETCEECDGVGVVEVGSAGEPIYPKFCWKCSGVGVVRDTWDIAEHVTLTEIERASKFLHSAKKIRVC